MTVVPYVNQFFAGLGAAEAAGHEPVRFDGPKGPGAGLGANGLTVDVTLACGDDHFGEHEASALATLLAWLDELAPDVLVCGPAFGSGRYGYACGVLAREAGRRGIPVVTALPPPRMRGRPRPRPLSRSHRPQTRPGWADKTRRTVRDAKSSTQPGPTTRKQALAANSLITRSKYSG